MNEKDDKRLNELETKCAFQEDTIERLSEELRKQQQEIIILKEELKFLKNLKSIGYTHIKTFKPHYSNKSVIKAFQRRFRQNLVNGFSDQECLLISKNLIK